MIVNDCTCIYTIRMFIRKFFCVTLPFLLNKIWAQIFVGFVKSNGPQWVSDGKPMREATWFWIWLILLWDCAVFVTDCDSSMNNWWVARGCSMSLGSTGSDLLGVVFSRQSCTLQLTSPWQPSLQNVGSSEKEMYTQTGITIRFGKNQPPLAEVGCIYGFDSRFAEGTPPQWLISMFPTFQWYPQFQTHVELRDMQNWWKRAAAVRSRLGAEMRKWCLAMQQALA